MIQKANLSFLMWFIIIKYHFIIEYQANEYMMKIKSLHSAYK